jgi:hypothetical protein
MTTTQSPHLKLFLAICALAAGCDSELDQAIDDLRAAMPDICKDYCEDKVTCEWEGSTATVIGKDAYSAAVQRCEIGCAFDTGRGAYVAENGVDEIECVERVSGGEIEDFLTCATDGNLFYCPDESHTFGGLVQSRCLAAEACLEGLGIDLHLAWSADTDGGGTCTYSGTQWLEAEFF